MGGQMKEETRGRRELLSKSTKWISRECEMLSGHTASFILGLLLPLRYDLCAISGSTPCEIDPSLVALTGSGYAFLHAFL